jgi:hypothetical protein
VFDATLVDARAGAYGDFHGHSDSGAEIFKYLEEAPSGINQVLYPALMKEHPEATLGLFMEKSYWYDTCAIAALSDVDSPARKFKCG